MKQNHRSPSNRRDRATPARIPSEANWPSRSIESPSDGHSLDKPSFRGGALTATAEAPSRWAWLSVGIVGAAVAGAAVGSLAMYLFDPNSGSERRHALGDKVSHLPSQVASGSRHLGSKAKQLASKARGRGKDRADVSRSVKSVGVGFEAGATYADDDALDRPEGSIV